MPAKRDVLFLALSLAGFVVLVGLGTWQLERREWKEALIASMTERAAGEPQSLATITARLEAGADIEFMRVGAHGRFLHDRELFVFSTSGRTIGWRLVTPLETEAGEQVLVDRGFVPGELRDPAARPESQPAGPVTVTGQARGHGREPGLFTPDNEPEANVWHWWDVAAMADAAGLERPLPFILHAEPRPGDSPWPQASVADPAAIPNRHLEYALTWFGLAAVLLIMTSVYWFGRLRRS